MDGRWGLGPVFAYEWLTTSRSPRVYATRAGFVLALLVVLVAVWMMQSEGQSPSTIRDFADAGASFYLGLVGAQLALVLLTAPAATAGAICLDRSRGTLAHVLVTDLSDPEIVLGKLAARLVPTLGLVLCALPVQFFAALLGGIDPNALIGSILVTLGVATFACSLALTLSVWGRKTQEVLIATYVVLLIWLLAYPTALAFRGGGTWGWKLDPFQLALAPYSSEPASAGWLDFVGFLVLMILASAALVGLAVLRLRAVAARGDGPDRTKPRREWRFARRFRPSLDADPVLWREWHRARPSRWSRRTWRFYYALAAIFSALAIVRWDPKALVDLFLPLVLGLETAIGLLLLSVDSATSLAEERARGSLDVLMTTPLTTLEIVRAKWRGAYRRVFGLAILPTIVTWVALDPDDRPLGLPITMGLILAYGAAITSLGLALATWVRRGGRAVSLGVGIYALVTIGGFFLTSIDDYKDRLAAMSPFHGPIFAIGYWSDANRVSGTLFALGWVAFYTVSAALLFLATLATFDRCLGRSRGSGAAKSDRPARGLRRRKGKSSPGPLPEAANHAFQK